MPARSKGDRGQTEGRRLYNPARRARQRIHFQRTGGGITKVALTKIDVFDSFDEIKVCVAYKDCRNDKVYTSYPTDVFIHKYLEPIYETLPGWKTPLSDIRKYEDLPENAKKYIARVEDLIGAPIGIISVGPDREQTIFV